MLMQLELFDAKLYFENRSSFIFHIHL